MKASHCVITPFVTHTAVTFVIGPGGALVYGRGGGAISPRPLRKPASQHVIVEVFAHAQKATNKKLRMRVTQMSLRNRFDTNKWASRSFDRREIAFSINCEGEFKGQFIDFFSQKVLRVTPMTSICFLSPPLSLKRHIYAFKTTTT